MLIKRILLLWLMAGVLGACSNPRKAPDVSGIQVQLPVERFERSLFDTTQQNLTAYLQGIQQQTPGFANTFLLEILNVDPAWSMDTVANYVNGFITSYRPVYDTAEKIFQNFKPYQAAVEDGLRYVKHYFPAYPLPQRLITYIGPADGYGDILMKDALVVGLQHHLGRAASLYRTSLVQQVYYDYITYHFEPDYIAVNALKNIAADIYPPSNSDKPLVHQMVEEGKRLYLLAGFLPNEDEHKLIGYTKQQLASCYQQEEVIWNMFVKNDYLQTTDKNIIKNYLGESPKTMELGEGAPGNIGSFAGWQIVKKYMQSHPETSLQALLQVDNEQLFQQAKYKP